MLNNVSFLKRLEHLMQYHDLSASAFADRIGVQRSSISHLLTGRNKPSLEFVMKVANSFKEANMDWLLYGKGHFPPDANEGKPADLFNAPQQKTIEQPPAPVKSLQETIKTPPSVGKSLAKIILLYTDGSFESFHPDK
tara:strand:- start:59502 stop:59915 length:414 start_codon:yes stop_codon:yes gene_type:complete